MKNTILVVAVVLGGMVGTESPARAGDCRFLEADDVLVLYGDSNYGGPCWRLKMGWPTNPLVAGRNDAWYFHNDWTSSMQSPGYNFGMAEHANGTGLNWNTTLGSFYLPNIEHLPKLNNTFVNMNDKISNVMYF